jgi:hypothetical protein
MIALASSILPVPIMPAEFPPELNQRVSLRSLSMAVMVGDKGEGGNAHNADD